MKTALCTDHPQATPELIHAVNNFLNLVVTTGQVALDRELDYSPERALEAILDQADELTQLVRSSRRPSGRSC
jgi:hypothetical protein